MPNDMSQEFETGLKNPLIELKNQVRGEFLSGDAEGAVSGVANFNIISEGSKVNIYDKKRGKIMFHQGNITPERQSNIYWLFDKINPSRKMERDTLYVTIAKPDPTKLPEDAAPFAESLDRIVGKDRSIIQFSYLQEDLSDPAVPLQKYTHLIVPDATAVELREIIRAGAPPNDLHNFVANVFTDKRTEKYFDATTLDPNDLNKILDKPIQFKNTHLSRMTTNLKTPIIRETINPNRLWIIAFDDEATKPSESTEHIAVHNVSGQEPKPNQVSEKTQPNKAVTEETRGRSYDLEITQPSVTEKEKSEHEFASRMKNAILQDLNGKFSDKNLLNIVIAIGETPNGKLSSDFLAKEAGDLVKDQKNYNPKELGVVLKVINSMITKKEGAMTKETQTPNREKTRAEKDRDKLYADLMWSDGSPEDYGDRWYAVNNEYYKGLSTKEQQTLDVELQLAQAVNIKRTAGDPKEFGDNKFMKGLSKKETRMLYETDGVRLGLELYQKYVDGARESNPSAKVGIRTKKETNGNLATENFSILECKHTDDVLQYRQMVENNIALNLEQKGYSKEEARNIAVRAERNSFNLHYLGNTFEVNDSFWNGNTREKTPTLSVAELVNPVLKGPMKPLDALVDKLLKQRVDLKEVGTLFHWAQTQVVDDLKSKGFTTMPDRFDKVVITTKTSDFWRVRSENNKTTLYAPECYQKKIVGSVWEETKINGRTLADYLGAGEVIPWNEPEANNFWQDYATKLSAAAVIWDIYTGKMRILPEKFTQIGGAAVHLAEWRNGFDRKLADLKLGDDWNMLRWLVYVSVGVKDERREPHLNTTKKHRAIITNVLSRYYIPKNLGKVTFDHDTPGKLDWAM